MSLSINAIPKLFALNIIFIAIGGTICTLVATKAQKRHDSGFCCFLVFSVLLVKLRSRHPGSFICVLIPEEDNILLISTKLPWSGQRAFHQKFWQKCQYRFVLVNEFHPAKWDTSNTIATYGKQPNLERASSTPVWLWQCPDSPNIEIALLMSTSSSS